MTHRGHDADHPDHGTHHGTHHRTHHPLPGDARTGETTGKDMGQAMSEAIDVAMDVADPADFLTNLPGLLGYYPCESLVLVFGDRDLDEPGPVLVRQLGDDDVDARAVRMAADAMADEGHERVDVYVIADSWAGTEQELERRFGYIESALESADLRVVEFAGVRALRAGEQVWSIDGFGIGTLGEPAASWASGHLHCSGEAISPDIDAMRERFLPEPAACRITAGEALRRAGGDVHGVRAGGLPGPAAMEQVREFHLEWLALVDAVDRGDVSVEDALGAPDHLRTLARPLVSLLLRDLTMCEILGPSADTVRVLWLGCGRLFRGSARSNALACYAIDRYLHGNASIAKAALDAAVDTDPEHSLSNLLFAAMASGRGDEALRSMLEATTAILGEVHPGGHGDADGPGPR
ncbi:DUF4192 domain-containing protein [Corynebacterium sp. NPDC060344]|uniref:DUF4192 domain-containing protein n=1 Tax=Corynebacterium sp. NPDC060344 TaxID=3347101 RepID=UPI0036693367